MNHNPTPSPSKLAAQAETPRTDQQALVVIIDCGNLVTLRAEDPSNGRYVEIDFARQLECELTRLKAELERANGLLTASHEMLSDAAEPDANQMAADWDREAQRLIRTITQHLNPKKTP